MKTIKYAYFLTASWGGENASQRIIGLIRAFSHVSRKKFSQDYGLGENTNPQGRIEHGRFHEEQVFLIIRAIKKILAVMKWIKTMSSQDPLESSLWTLFFRYH